jgi:chromodomain-helicase-DNA-binding protein 1
MSSSPEPEAANGYSNLVVRDDGGANGDAHIESDMSEVDDSITARPQTSASADYDQSADEIENTFEEEDQEAVASSESDNDNQSDDADFDMEGSPAASHSDGAQDERSASNSSRQSTKRKTTNDEEDYIKANPELYGLRRSVCRRKIFSSVHPANQTHSLDPANSPKL